MKKITSFPKSKLKVLLVEGIHASAMERFRNSGYSNIKSIKGALSTEELLRELRDTHILGMRSKTDLTHDTLLKAPRLFAVGCFCIGTNQVDLKTATQAGIAVFNAPYSNTRSVAELVIGEIIFLMRRIVEKNLKSHAGVWWKESSGSYEVRGKTLGIIGYGHIGSQVSILAEGIGMKVRYFDIEPKLPLGNASPSGSLTSLLKESDAVTLHVPGGKDTFHLVGEREMKSMKKGSILLNLSRGNVVDIPTLKKFILNGHLAGAALDVFPNEPEVKGNSFESGLEGLPNVILTPHIGGSTVEAQESIGLDVADKLIQFSDTGSTHGSHTIPQVNLPMINGAHRILHIHRNVPGILSAVNGVMSDLKINILGQYLKTNEEIGYVVLDVEKRLSKKAFDSVKSVDHTIRTRILY